MKRAGAVVLAQQTVDQPCVSVVGVRGDHKRRPEGLGSGGPVLDPVVDIADADGKDRLIGEAPSRFAVGLEGCLTLAAPGLDRAQIAPGLGDLRRLGHDLLQLGLRLVELTESVERGGEVVAQNGVILMREDLAT